MIFRLIHFFRSVSFFLPLTPFLLSEAGLIDSHTFGVFFFIAAMVFLFCSLPTIFCYPRFVILLALAVIILLFICATSPNNQAFSIKILAILLSAFAIPLLVESRNSFFEILFCRGIILVMAYVLCLALLNSGEKNFVFGIYNDKNYLGLQFFICFLMSFKKRLLVGVFVPVLYALLCSDSRSLWGLLLLFLFFEYVPCLRSLILQLGRSHKILFIFFSMLAATGVVYLMSLWMVQSNVDFSEYKESLVDESNFMRSMANVEAVSEITQNKLYFAGYGDESSLKEQMGIDEDRPLLIDGVRLVQPHNCVINVALRSGVVFAFVYFILVSCLLANFFTEANIAYMLPYLVNCMFMHSLLSFDWLFIWVFVLSLKVSNRWRLI